MRGDALGQATRATEEVARMTKALGYAPRLQPVLVFPGWWTQSAGPVWVCGPCSSGSGGRNQ